jgi:5-methyltetrahydrofolate--homocysteine methyltransferase
MEEAKREAAEFMKVRAVWQFLGGEAEGDALHLFAPGGSEPQHTIGFKRQ